MKLIKLAISDLTTIVLCQLGALSDQDLDLLPQKYQSSSCSEKRQKQHIASRQALKEALRHQSISYDHWSDIQISPNHSQLTPLNESVQLSLSHTQNDWAAAVATREFSSIGVDIEPESRSFKEGSAKYFINESDQVNKDSLLEVWTQKEAAFKALSPLVQESLEEDLLLKHISIDEQSNFFHRLKKEPFGKVVSLKANDHIISLATIT